MSTRTIAWLSVIAFVFGAAFLGVIVAQKNKTSAPSYKPQVELAPFEGRLAFQWIDDLSVNGRRIILCGAAYTKPQSMRAMVTEAARRDYQGLALKCKPVGTGTPCDGNVASTFAGAVVVQCFMPDGVDLAVKLTQDGVLCGQPSQAGTTYKPC